MTLFSPDLYRNFLIGFAAGGLILAAGLVEGVDGVQPEIHSKAQASETLRPVNEDLNISDEFLIAEETREVR